MSIMYVCHYQNPLMTVDSLSSHRCNTVPLQLQDGLPVHSCVCMHEILQLQHNYQNFYNESLQKIIIKRDKTQQFSLWLYA